jgi:hypothetical protein
LRPDGIDVVVTERSTCVICAVAFRRLARRPDGLAVRRRPSRASSSVNHSNGDHS